MDDDGRNENSCVLVSFIFPAMDDTICIETAKGLAWVIDNAFDVDTLDSIDRFRVSLELDSKRPTVDRRFFADAASIASFFAEEEEKKNTDANQIDNERPLASRIEDAIARSSSSLGLGLQTIIIDDGDDNRLSSQSSSQQQTKKKVHVLRYQRFLEYTKSGSGLDPHTDGTKVCCDHPDDYTSTHTMLLYLTDCQNGGETVLLSECSPVPNSTKSSILYSCVPKRGRLLLFPHATPHAGMPVIDLPKICLRAEVCLSFERKQ
jgi:hypothetical protein